MAHILITSGPTRENLDPVRYLSNGSSGRMGAALATAAANAGYRVTVISGPVQVDYPESAQVIYVNSTEEMLDACLERFPSVDGVIAAAAPCDYRPQHVARQKIKKGAKGLSIDLVPTPDILSALGQQKRAHQWSVGFALETENGIENAWQKMIVKNCDWICLNEPTAIDSDENQLVVIDRQRHIVEALVGPKRNIANRLIELISTQWLQHQA